MSTIALDPDRVAGELRACLGPLVRRLRSVRGEGELTLSQASVLVRLERDGPSSPGVLAAGEEITAQSMGAILNALVSNGLVARSSDPQDGRKVTVAITPAGRRSLQGVRQERARWLARAIAELTLDEQRQLVEAIPVLERLGRLV